MGGRDGVDGVGATKLEETSSLNDLPQSRVETLASKRSGDDAMPPSQGTLFGPVSGDASGGASEGEVNVRPRPPRISGGSPIWDCIYS